MSELPKSGGVNQRLLDGLRAELEGFSMGSETFDRGRNDVATAGAAARLATFQTLQRKSPAMSEQLPPDESLAA